MSEEITRYFFDGKSVGRIEAMRRTVNASYSVHWHDFFEIEIIIDGEGINNLNGSESVMKRGMAYILNPTDFHSVSTTKAPLRLWNISFDEEIVSDKRLCMLSSRGARKSFSLDELSMKQACSIAELIAEESKRSDGGCCRELCECLLSIIFRSDDGTANATGNATGIRKALLYLDVHFRENPSLSQTANQAGFHPHYFSELFKKTTGESYSSHLNSLKIGYAKTLLSNGFSVTDSCYRSGFGSLSNFLLVFKKQTGITPEEYKSRKRG